MSDVHSVEIARRLIQIPSVNPSYDPASRGEVDVAEWIAAWGRDHGLEVNTQPVVGNRSNVILTVNGRGPGRHLMLNGHMDTVGVSGMTIDPFAGETNDGRLYGRGSADMKGPLACMLASLLILRESAASWTGKVTVSAVVDEEYRFVGIQKLLSDHEPIDFAVVGEPTMLHVIRGCKGCLRLQVTTLGRAAHSSRPREGASAISAMARVITLLEDYFARQLESIHAEGFGSSTGSIGLIHGGIGVNIVPDRCEIQVDVRLLPGQDGLVVHREIIQLLSNATLPAGTNVMVSDPLLHDPAFELSAEHPFVCSLLATLHQKKADVAWFSCDASKIAAKGIPCVVLGPGNIQEAHTARESIGLAELEEGTTAYVRLAHSLLGTSAMSND